MWLIQLIQILQHNFELIYGVVGTTEVLFLATFITLRSNFINDAANASINAAQHSNNAIISSKWRRRAHHLRKAAESRTYSLNLSIWGFVIFLVSLGLAISYKVSCWPTTLFFISISFLIAALVNFICIPNAQRQRFNKCLPKCPVGSSKHKIKRRRCHHS